MAVRNLYVAVRRLHVAVRRLYVAWGGDGTVVSDQA